MRTTVTLDRDVDVLLREAMHRSRGSFKTTLNEAIRAGLRLPRTRAAGRAFVLQARPLGLLAGLDPAGLNRLADDLEIDAVCAKARKGSRG